MSSALERAWYQGRWWLVLLRPLSWLFVGLSAYIRRRDQAAAAASKLPVVVIGNISLGGTGKTPLIISLVKRLQQKGLRPGVISRGYGSQSSIFPLLVKPNSEALLSGDEPLLIAQSCVCPVVIDPDRNAALSFLEKNTDCDIVLSDDGLQHYKLFRHWEIAVVDGQRGLGNGQCLPAGPLREQPQRLQTVDWIMINQAQPKIIAEIETYSDAQVPIATMAIKPSAWRNVYSGERRPIATGNPEVGAKQKAFAVAAIGNPERFFTTLTELGVVAEMCPFPDHHRYQGQDLDFASGQVVFMTAKDAVKCAHYQGQLEAQYWWVLEVEAELSDEFMTAFESQLASLM